MCSHTQNLASVTSLLLSCASECQLSEITCSIDWDEASGQESNKERERVMEYIECNFIIPTSVTLSVSVSRSFGFSVSLSMLWIITQSKSFELWSQCQHEQNMSRYGINTSNRTHLSDIHCCFGWNSTERNKDKKKWSSLTDKILLKGHYFKRCIMTKTWKTFTISDWWVPTTVEWKEFLMINSTSHLLLFPSPSIFHSTIVSLSPPLLLASC